MVQLMVTKRTGEVVDFDFARIKNAISKAIRSTGKPISPDVIERIVEDIVEEVGDRFQEFYPNVENIQDIVEKHLVMNGLYEIAKNYILYRANRQKVREQEKERTVRKSLLGKLTVQKRDGRTVLFNIKRVKDSITRAGKDYEDVLDDSILDKLSRDVARNLYDGVTTEEIGNATVLATIAYIEKDPGFSKISARLLLQNIYKEVIGRSVSERTLKEEYKKAFMEGIKKSVEADILDKRMLDFDLEKLADNLAIERDDFFDYMGIRSLDDRYFIDISGKKMELPQAFWMRVAMGLSFDEDNKEERALEFYKVLSNLRFVSSTPTLFYSGYKRSQLSSCYLTTVSDDLHHIFKCIGDNAQMAKYHGGIANDWSSLRGKGAIIKKIVSESQGIVPFLKIANDTVVISKTGRRRGGTCAYLETWHLDIEEFINLRKNTGDERRRTHDMNTSNWIPDLFMKRVLNDEEWTLFSPDEAPELHELYGRAFEKKYVEYEEKARKGKVKSYKVLSAKKLWRKMLSMLFETGHPWITFKDPCNIRSPQDHVGIVHSSNLCTEITLNTSENETAVCNLGSVNIIKHITNGALDKELLAETIKTGMRMLDNVIDLNFYPTIEGKNSNLRHRPIGMGIMGLQDSFFVLGMPFDSPAAAEFNDSMMELVSYNAILSSSELARERGTYESYKGSKWDRGLLPIDSLRLLEEERGMKLEVSFTSKLDWTPVRENIKKYGMRNSNTMAIAPTATIANISGSYPSIEPIYKNIYVKANVSGEFTIANAYLIKDLKKLGLWNDEMLNQIKYYDGSIQNIPEIPEELKAKYKEAFEIDPLVVLRLAAARSKWIDQSQSVNIFMKGTSGSKLNEIYNYAWRTGLKTTYYLRTLGASQIEKSTLDTKYGFTQKREYDAIVTQARGTAVVTLEAPKAIVEVVSPQTRQVLEAPQQLAQAFSPGTAAPKLCRLDDPDCESCQ